MTRSGSRYGWSGWLVVMALVGFWLATAVAADRVQLRDGRTIEGDVVREDGTQVLVVVDGSPTFFTAGEVESIEYDRVRFVSPAASPATAAAPALEPVEVDARILRRIQERLPVLRRIVGHFQRLQGHHRRGEAASIEREVQDAVRRFLPTHHGVFSALTVVVDIVILLGLRVPLLWLALVLVKEPREFGRIVSFILPAYGGVMALMGFTVSVGQVGLHLWLIPVTLIALVGLFTWLFTVSLPRAVMALGVLLALTLGVEVLLAEVGWL